MGRADLKFDQAFPRGQRIRRIPRCFVFFEDLIFFVPKGNSAELGGLETAFVW